MVYAALWDVASSARSHGGSRVARLDGKGVALLDVDGDGGVDGVGEGAVTVGEAELIDALLCWLVDACLWSHHCEGDERERASGRLPLLR